MTWQIHRGQRGSLCARNVSRSRQTGKSDDEIQVAGTKVKGVMRDLANLYITENQRALFIRLSTFHKSTRNRNNPSMQMRWKFLPEETPPVNPIIFRRVATHFNPLSHRLFVTIYVYIYIYIDMVWIIYVATEFALPCILLFLEGNSFNQTPTNFLISITFCRFISIFYLFYLNLIVIASVSNRIESLP